MRPTLYLSIGLMAFGAVLGLIAVGGWKGALVGSLIGAGATIASVFLLDWTKRAPR